MVGMTAGASLLQGEKAWMGVKRAKLGMRQISPPPSPFP